MGTYSLQVDNLNYKYPNHDDYVLKNINLWVKNGEFIFITGKVVVVNPPWPAASMEFCQKF